MLRSASPGARCSRTTARSTRCAPGSTPGPASAVTVGTAIIDEEDIEDNKALVRRFFEETWNKGNPDAVDDYIAASCVTKNGDPVSPLVKRGITNWRRGFPDFAYLILRLVAEDDYVVAWTRFTGTHRGVFHHVLGNRTLGPWEPTGKTIDVPEVYMSRVAAGKIAEIGAVWRELEFIEQLGVTLASARATT